MNRWMVKYLITPCSCLNYCCHDKVVVQKLTTSVAITFCCRNVDHTHLLVNPADI